MIATATKMQEAKDQDAEEVRLRDQRIRENFPLVRAIALRVHSHLPAHVDLDDLIHAGVLGLYEAVKKYDASKSVAFASYAKHRIRGAILDSLRQLDWASRDMRRRRKQAEAATYELTVKLERAPTEAEIAERLGIRLERWRVMKLDMQSAGLISASARAEESQELPPPDFPAGAESRPDSICCRRQLRSMLGEAMRTLPERYRKVVALYYAKQMTMKEIGGILGVNESRVSQIHKLALNKMAVALQANGIRSSQAF
ncbi:MAG TPA: FliA/WhiG family RNA polymerase sigma factor [Bryobacteraceae bacterium]|nr:FliA/WhiG family RNA polymerase sigma factor [Bryobacteraceae bacterium]